MPVEYENVCLALDKDTEKLLERGVVALEHIAEVLERVTCEMQSGHTVIKIDGYVGLKR